MGSKIYPEVQLIFCRVKLIERYTVKLVGGINACKGKVNYIDMLSALAERIYPKMQLICFLIFGSYALHTDPKSEAILDVSVSVCQCVSGSL